MKFFAKKNDAVAKSKNFSKDENEIINDVVLISIGKIKPNPAQPRVVFEQTDLQNLAQSIKNNGLLQPITVRKNDDNFFEIISGERRLKAATIAGFLEVPCIVIKTTDEQSAIFALIENLQRKDLNFFEEAVAIEQLIKKWNITQDEAATKLGKAQSTIANKLRLLKFNDNQKKLILENNLTERHARVLLRIKDGFKLEEIVKIIEEKKLNVSQTEKFVDEILKSKEKPEIKKTIIPIVKDFKIFFKTLDGAVKKIRKAGINAEIQKETCNGCLKYIVSISGR